MNAKQASLLMLHEVVMMNNDPTRTGTVRGIDPIHRKVMIDWRYCCGRPIWHKFNEMTSCEKWQPTDDQIMEETMISQLEEDAKHDPHV